MTLFMDRRSVLTSLGAVGVMGCSQAPVAQEPGERSRPASPVVVTPAATLDLSALEARYGGRIGFSAIAMSGGRSVNWRSRERFVYCSTFKMYLAAATLVRIQNGQESRDRLIPITQTDMVNHAPVTQPAIGSTLSIERLMQAVVEVSDNPAANLLLKANGGLEAMQAFYRTLGDESTRVDRFEPEMNRLDGDKDTIMPSRSVGNMIRLFLQANSPLNAASKEVLLGWMFASPTGADRLKAGVPTGWRVAHKTGTGGYGPTNDIGLMYPPSGKPIVAAVYYHATRETSDAQNAAVIAEATRMALTALGHTA